MTYYGAEVGNIFTSNSNATYFIRSLANTNRSPFGTSDFERVQGVEGILLANIVSNPDRIGAGEPKLIESRISFNDGGSWGFLQMPTKDAMGNRYGCVVDEGMRATEKCALHLYSVTSPGRNLGSVYSVKGYVNGRNWCCCCRRS